MRQPPNQVHLDSPSNMMLGGQARHRPDSFYGSRPVSMKPDGGQYPEYIGARPAQNSGYDEQGYNPNNMTGYGSQPGASSSRQRPPKQQYPDGSGYNNSYNAHGRDQRGAHDQTGYQLSHKDRSYETVTSAAASGSSDPAGYQTDPTSSDNSSIERRSPAKRPEPVNDYGIGFGQSSGGPDASLAVGLGQRTQHPPPPTPASGSSPYPAQVSANHRKEAPSVLRRMTTQQSATSPDKEKRKSWFSRKFSKQA